MQCTAKSKRSGERCNNHAMKGKTVCRMHGGKSKSGIEHPNYKTGRYVKGLADKKAKVVDNLLRDEDLLRLDDNIALMDLRIIELVDSLMVGGNPADLWKQALRSWQYLDRAIDRIDADAIERHNKELGNILEKGIKETATWDEIDQRTDTRRRLVDTEMRRREKMKYMVLVEDTLKDYLAIARVVKETILDVDIPKETKVMMLQRIQNGLASVMSIAIPEGVETTTD